MRRLLTFVVFLTLLGAFGNQGWVKLYRLHQFEKGLDEEINLLAQNNFNLQKEIHDLKDSRYLESYIREELGFLKQNEIVYELPEEH